MTQKNDAAPGAGSGKPDWAMSRREIEAVLRARAGLPPVPSRKRWVWAVLALVLVAGLAYWATQGRTAELEEPVEEAPVAETVMRLSPAEHLTAEPQDLRRTVSVYGSLSPLRRAAVSAETSGVIREVAVSVGDAVAAGDVLVRLGTEALEIDLNAARSTAEATRSQVVLAEAEAERSRTLVSRGVTTAAAAEQAEANLANLRAGLAAQEDQIAAAELRLRDATVRAPIAGVVSERSVDPGEYVGTGTALLSLVDSSVMRLDARAPVSSAGVLSVGMPVSVKTTAGPEAEGRVAAVSPVTTEGARSLRVFVDVPNPDGALLGGMFARGSVVVAAQDAALAVPADALREDADGPHLLRIRDGRLERADVVLGETWPGDLVEIVEGVAAGDVLVSAPLPDLTVGQAVTASEE